jgi:hypothetical protein
VETNTWTGSSEGRVNEDYALALPEQGCAVLVDGATGLTKTNLVAGESDASWYARCLGKAILAHLDTTHGLDHARVTNALAVAGTEVAEAYRCLPGADVLRHIDEPSASLVVLSWDAANMLVTLLGDCTAVVGLRDQTCHKLHDNTLTQLDDENYERMYAYATDNGTTMAQARRALNPHFIENRLKMDEPGGYWAADISCRGMTHATTSVFPAKDVSWILACSDGYAAAVDMGVVPDASELGRQVSAGQGQRIGELLRAAEREDAGCWRVHRSKTSDDATYLLISFS